MKRTYVDSGVLIAAARGSGRLADAALRVISDETREFVSSDYVRLEVIPKPTYLGRDAEVRFYERFFASVTTWLPFDNRHMEDAFAEACRSGLSALDAVHVVVAAGSGCEELVTSEKSVAAIHRTNRVPVLSIDVE